MFYLFWSFLRLAFKNVFSWVKSRIGSWQTTEPCIVCQVINGGYDGVLDFLFLCTKTQTIDHFERVNTSILDK